MSMTHFLNTVMAMDSEPRAYSQTEPEPQESSTIPKKRRRPRAVFTRRPKVRKVKSLSYFWPELEEELGKHLPSGLDVVWKQVPEESRGFLTLDDIPFVARIRGYCTVAELLTIKRNILARYTGIPYVPPIGNSNTTVMSVRKRRANQRFFNFNFSPRFEAAKKPPVEPKTTTTAGSGGFVAGTTGFVPMSALTTSQSQNSVSVPAQEVNVTWKEAMKVLNYEDQSSSQLSQLAHPATPMPPPYSME